MEGTKYDSAHNLDANLVGRVAGFSREEIASLFRIKARYQRGAYYEAPYEYKRLAFVRWLYQQGRLQSEAVITRHAAERMGNGTEPFLSFSSSEQEE